MHLKRNVINGVWNLNAADLQRYFSDMAFSPGKFLIQCPANNHVNDFIHIGGFAIINFSREWSVSKYGGPITNLLDFLHAMRNVDKSHAFFLQGGNNMEKILNLIFWKRRGRFIQNNDRRILWKDFYNFHNLLICYGEPPHLRSRIDVVYAQLTDPTVTLTIHPFPIN